MPPSITYLQTPDPKPHRGNAVVLGSFDQLRQPTYQPLFLSRISAGFPSPADDYIERTLSLDEHLVKRPEATFFLRVQGDSMIGVGIHDGDLLVVDKSLTAQHNSIVIAEIHGELTVKRLYHLDNEIALLAENPDYQPIPINEESQLVIWGVVTNVVHSLREAGSSHVRLDRREQLCATWKVACLNVPTQGWGRNQLSHQPYPRHCRRLDFSRNRRPILSRYSRTADPSRPLGALHSSEYAAPFRVTRTFTNRPSHTTRSSQTSKGLRARPYH
ncbi:translesion error-prone DNA polymerase V autoproteolytic subunit [Methylococcus sp. EFPC2]|nr:translesion error-prone DNA polymerase V autoproteolytic subunit [Methylococcus sp. EFPC2]